VGLVVSGLVYLLLSRSLDLSAEQSAIEASERQLTAIDTVAQAASGPAGARPPTITLRSPGSRPRMRASSCSRR
jgi:hypothetical protein